MIQLKKVTLNYVAVEDRIRMSAERQNGEPVVFWLTMRLCRSMVGPLCGYIEKNVQPSALVDRTTQLSVQQRQAMWELQPSEPVRTGNEITPVIPDRLDLEFLKNKVALRLPYGIREKAELQMNPQELRQWMDILYRMFRSGAWPMDEWPDWMQAEPRCVN